MPLGSRIPLVFTRRSSLAGCWLVANCQLLFAQTGAGDGNRTRGLHFKGSAPLRPHAPLAHSGARCAFHPCPTHASLPRCKLWSGRRESNPRAAFQGLRSASPSRSVRAFRRALSVSPMSHSRIIAALQTLERETGIEPAGSISRAPLRFALTLRSRIPARAERFTHVPLTHHCRVANSGAGDGNRTRG